ncbi:methyltransferase family protein [Rhizobium sp. ERR 922]|uniref:class I SAM-dependent methyltransferase n=1 Tax=unclassified Rhizobium TaxID=2613769 RepID=UPI0011A5F2BE|nr:MULTISPECIES: class I SAM-dependent methyltransferase [unclassified Rhizobium]TWB51688.1 methyltransferase family protein [Rhizobium sp. ERR 922]TWB94110.1 methyltransferase family protein [Rhizobium sp. ERR 942]
MRNADQFDEEYYKSGFGPDAYERTAPWLNFYARIVDEIIRSLQPRRVLDAGCALGMVVEAFWDRGIEAKGVDISEYAIANVRADMREHCRVASLTKPFESRYDLVVCIEVLEHMPAEEAALAIQNIAASTDTVLFSSSPRDFEEVTHVNVRPPLSWMKLFGQHGLWPDLIYDASYLTPHAILFRRSEAISEDALILMSEQLRLRFLLAEAKQAQLAADTQAARVRDEARSAQQQAQTALDQTLREMRMREQELAAALEKAAREGLLHAQETMKLRAIAADARQQAVSEIEEMRARVVAIESSTFWRASRPARAFAANLPAPFRRRLRQLARVGYWAATPHRIPARLAFLKEQKNSHIQSSLSSTVQASHFTTTVNTTDLTNNTRVVPSTLSMIRKYSIDWEPLPVFQDRSSAPTLTILTDSVDANSLFGGVGTSLVVGALVARRLNARLRLVTRTSAPDPAALGKILQAHKVKFDGPTDFVHMPIGEEKPLPVGEEDLFLTTSWWGTRAVLGSVNPNRILYLLQEDERMFYPHSDMRLRCAETLSEPDVRVLVNTRLLFDHLADGPDPLPQLRERGHWFEPAFPTFARPEIIKPRNGKKNFFFYARPNHARNLYWRGLEVVDAVVREGLLPSNEWDLHFVGHELPEMELSGGVRPKIWAKLPWLDYADLISQMDLGLSLMDTPHPSYPPLDLAASGAIVVTNTHGSKISLARWSDNIIAVPPTVASLTEALYRGVARADDTKQRTENCIKDHIPRDWEATIGPTLDKLLSLGNP